MTLRKESTWNLIHSVVWLYLLLVVAAELLLSLVSLEVGLIAYAALILCFTLSSGLFFRASIRELSLALLLVPLARVIGLASPMGRLPPLAQPLWISLLLGGALWLLVQHLKIQRAELGLTNERLPLQLLFASSGVLFGVASVDLFNPAPLLTVVSPLDLIAPSLVLFGAALVEELLFQGVIHQLATRVLGSWAPFFAAALVAGLSLSHRSLWGSVAAFAVVLAYCYMIRWSGSILGVVVSHAISSIVSLLLIPYLQAFNTDLAVWVIPLFYGLGGVSTALALVIAAIGGKQPEKPRGPEEAAILPPVLVPLPAAQEASPAQVFQQPKSGRKHEDATATGQGHATAAARPAPRHLSQQAAIAKLRRRRRLG